MDITLLFKNVKKYKEQHGGIVDFLIESNNTVYYLMYDEYLMSCPSEDFYNRYTEV